MADYRKIAKQAALKYGIDPYIFIRQIKAESGFNPNVVSSAGARGIAQIMPATARAWGVNPDDPVAALNAAAKNMASYKRKYKTYRNALIAYNAGPGRVGKPLYSETANYINKILINGEPKRAYPRKTKGTSAKVSSQPTAAAPTGAPDLNLGAAQPQPVQPTITAPATPEILDGRQHLAMPQGSAQAALPATPPQIPEAPQVDLSAPQAGGSAAAAPAGPAAAPTAPQQAPAGKAGKGTVKFAGGANRGGQSMQKPFMSLAQRAAGYHGSPLVVTTGTNHNQMTTTGNVSDHWGGNAADFAIGGDIRQNRKLAAKGDRIAASFLMAAGISAGRARAMARKGGVFNITYRGRRMQLIWRSNTGGNHYNHVHVGYR